MKLEYQRALGLLLAVLVVAQAAVIPVAASHDDGGLLESLAGQTDDDEGGVAAALSSVGVDLAGIMFDARSRVAEISYKYGGDEPDYDPVEEADRIERHFNDRSTEWAAWMNEHTRTGAYNLSAYDTHKIVLVGPDGDRRATRYLVAEHNETGWTDAEMMDQASFDQLNRTVDETHELRGLAAENAYAEYRRYYAEHVDPGEPVDAGYVGSLAKYKRFVDSTLVDSHVDGDGGDA